jgi:hypothetical protein
VHRSKSDRSCPLWIKSGGDDQDDAAPYVRFAPKADKRADVLLSLLCAITGLMRCSKIARYSITSSASDSKLSESFRPSVLAVCRLIAISNLMGCNTGISAGFAPLRTLPA